jgi:hypothetical protein
MSAMLIETVRDDELAAPRVGSAPRWRHVPQTRGPVARPMHPAAPGGRPSAAPAAPLVRVARPVAAPASQGWQLTRRGLAVVMTLFLGMVAAATITAVAAFVTISNEPVQAGQGSVVSVARG